MPGIATCSDYNVHTLTSIPGFDVDASHGFRESFKWGGDYQALRRGTVEPLLQNALSVDYGDDSDVAGGVGLRNKTGQLQIARLHIQPRFARLDAAVAAREVGS
jgi:hypothetical protein